MSQTQLLDTGIVKPNGGLQNTPARVFLQKYMFGEGLQLPRHHHWEGPFLLFQPLQHPSPATVGDILPALAWRGGQLHPGPYLLS